MLCASSVETLTQCVVASMPPPVPSDRPSASPSPSPSPTKRNMSTPRKLHRSRSGIKRKTVPTMDSLPTTPSRREDASSHRASHTPKGQMVADGVSHDSNDDEDEGEGAFGRTPDSLRIRRMRFEFDVEIDGGRRRRTASHSELMMGSPGKKGHISREWLVFSTYCHSPDHSAK